MKTINGFDKDGKISSSLVIDEKAKGLFKPDGSPTHKVQTLLLHNNVLTLVKRIEVLESKLANKTRIC